MFIILYAQQVSHARIRITTFTWPCWQSKKLQLSCATEVVADIRAVVAGFKLQAGSTDLQVVQMADMAAPEDTKEICGICLDVPNMPVELGCSHAFCCRCLMTAHEKHHNRCPVCRHEHVLDPIALRDKMVAYRAAYGNWRKGGVKGAHGEPDSIGKVAITAAPISPIKSKDQLLPRKRQLDADVHDKIHPLTVLDGGMGDLLRQKAPDRPW